MEQIECAEDLVKLIHGVGFLPFFRGNIAGFSVEEHCPAELWFADDREGPWEWKGPVIRTGTCVYGKLFGGKAGFVAKEWAPDLFNYRRDGYDFDARCDEGLAPYKDQAVMRAVAAQGKMLSKEIKRRCNYKKGGNVGFETVITRLQMQTYLVVSDFVYLRDRFGRPYGWGVAEYAPPELLFGEDFFSSAYKVSPARSKGSIEAHLKALLPQASAEEIAGLLG